MNFVEILRLLAQGAVYTLLVTVACSLTALAFGIGLATLRRMGGTVQIALLDGISFFLRGVPVLVLLFLVYFGLPGLGIKVPPLVAMMLSLGLIAGAYCGEVFRGAFDLVDAQEILAARAMGMSRWQTLLTLELPQVLRFSVPGMVNEFTTVLKYSPFAYTVGIPEITKQAMSLSSATLRGVEIYCAAGILYFALYRFLLLGVEEIERRTRIPGMSPSSN